jgi:hypothetical protein
MTTFLSFLPAYKLRYRYRFGIMAHFDRKTLVIARFAPSRLILSLTARLPCPILAANESYVQSRVVARLLLFCSMYINKIGTEKVPFHKEAAWI